MIRRLVFKKPRRFEAWCCIVTSATQRNKISLKFKKCAISNRTIQKSKKTQKTQKNLPETLENPEDTNTDPRKAENRRKNAVLCHLTKENASKDPEERRNLSKVCSKNPENSMRVQNVLILINFIILNVVSQIGDGTGSTRSLFLLF